MNGEPIRLCEAVAGDAAELTRIAFAAKRHWGYPESWIEMWSPELTVDEQYVAGHAAWKATCGAQTIGWCAVDSHDGEIWLDYCWVLPASAGRGAGRRLVEKALDHATGLGAETVRVVADPHAEGFYRKLGFYPVGRQPSVPAGRVLPVLECRVGDRGARRPDVSL